MDEISKKFTKCKSHSGFRGQASDEEDWYAGKKKWIAVTTGLIQGIDNDKVAATIFLDMPFGFLNLYQGSGHGGHDGQKSWSIILLQKNKGTLAKDKPDPNNFGCK